MKPFVMASLLLAYLVNIVATFPSNYNATDVSTNERGLVERDAVYYCDDKAWWLGSVNCAYIWAGIYYLEDKVGSKTLSCGAYSRCRWSCSYNTGLYFENTSKKEIKITGKGFANEVRDLIQNCRHGATCSESKMNNYWFQGEKNYGRDEHKIMISHTTPFNENC